MNKTVCILAFGLLAGAASAASKVVISDEDGATVDLVPAYSFTFTYGDDASVDTTNVNGAVVMDFAAPNSKASAGAGYGFGWSQTCTTAGTCTDKVMSLSAYKGVCLTYEAQEGFRVDFKQSTITDDNYYGAELAAAASPKKVFIAFADLSQGWKSTTTKAWSAASQLGMQFSFKNTHAKAAGAATDEIANNQVTLHSLILADECTTNAPAVTEGFAGYNGGTITLAEGAIHTMSMPEVFEDADGDSLVITVSIESENKSVVLVDSTAYDQSSTIQFTTAQNPEGDAVVTLTATDPTKKTATFSFTIKTEDTENLPVAKSSTFTVKEDSVLKVGLGSALTKYGSDVDGDEIALKLVTKTKHGTLELDEDTGIFSYTPDADFFGADTFTYKFVETADETRESEVANGVIKVENVNDEPVVDVLAETFTYDGEEKAFGDTLTVDEDFEAFEISIPKANFSITDADGESDYSIVAKASAVFSAELAAGEENYVITVTAKKDSNGMGRLTMVVADPKVSIPTVIAYVKVNAVVDPVTPVADKYDVYQDSLNEISAKNGVMANDENPDKDTVAIAVLSIEPEHGTVVLNKDGSFTYQSEEDYTGEDYFGYKIENADGTTSKMAVVTLNVLYKNKAPQVAEGVADTVNARLDTLREDFVAVTYKKAELESWFTDDSTAASKLKYTVTSKDSTLAASITSAGAILVKAVKDVCGDVSMTVTAADAQGASTDLLITATLECVNDKPVFVADTIYIEKEGDTLVYNLNNLATDADGDVLTFTAYETGYLPDYFVMTQEDSILTLVSLEDVGLKKDMVFPITVKVADSTMANAETPTTITGKLVVKVGTKDEEVSIKPVMASAKMNWQGAIQGTRGVAALFDMQGRVMWKAKLPVSESTVREAAASVQGRKVLRVNSQVFTIK